MWEKGLVIFNISVVSVDFSTLYMTYMGPIFLNNVIGTKVYYFTKATLKDEKNTSEHLETCFSCFNFSHIFYTQGFTSLILDHFFFQVRVDSEVYLLPLDHEGAGVCYCYLHPHSRLRADRRSMPRRQMRRRMGSNSSRWSENSSPPHRTIHLQKDSRQRGGG